MMPWIRNIYLVTSGQVPKFLNDQTIAKLNVTIIDHRSVFNGLEWALPTFNSRTIETVLYRIPDLAQRYVYFNDDVIPVRPSTPMDFFIDDKVVLRGEWKPLRHYRLKKSSAASVFLKLMSKLSKKDRSAHLLAQMRAAELAGFTERYFHSSHAPHPVRTKTLKNFFFINPEILERNINYKFRNINQFVTHPLAHHLEASQNMYEIQEASDNVTINYAKPEEVEAGLKAMHSADVKFVCIQGLELASEESKVDIVTFLRKQIELDEWAG